MAGGGGVERIEMFVFVGVDDKELVGLVLGLSVQEDILHGWLVHVVERA